MQEQEEVMEPEATEDGEEPKDRPLSPEARRLADLIEGFPRDTITMAQLGSLMGTHARPVINMVLKLPEEEREHLKSLGLRD